MGRVFLEHPNGSIIYHCKRCKTPLTNRKSLLSTQFTGATGNAYLFKSAVNILEGKMEKRTMITGDHFVRDVFCKYCRHRLGWTYEMALEKKQIYKESRVILEKALILQSSGVEPDTSDDSDDSEY